MKLAYNQSSSRDFGRNNLNFLNRIKFKSRLLHTMRDTTCMDSAEWKLVNIVFCKCSTVKCLCSLAYFPAKIMVKDQQVDYFTFTVF